MTIYLPIVFLILFNLPTLNFIRLNLLFLKCMTTSSINFTLTSSNIMKFSIILFHFNQTCIFNSTIHQSRLAIQLHILKNHQTSTAVYNLHSFTDVWTAGTHSLYLLDSRQL